MLDQLIRNTRAAGLFVCALGLSAAHAVPVVTPLIDASPASAASLVASLLAPVAPGLTIVAGSAQYSGAAAASGTFASGGTSPVTGLGINTGVVLTTGDARFIGSSAAFAGDDANKSGTFTAGVGNGLTANSSPGSALLDVLTTFGTQNASVLSFQIVPQASVLTLSFVFGSEDYNDVVNSGFPTDVFGIFVNGVNYARAPGSGLPISASTVNCGGPTSGPANNVGAANCASFRDNAPFFGSIESELDGVTILFNLAIPVNVGVVNSIAIGIADTLDASGDSALMLSAGSIAAVPEPASVGLMLAGMGAVALAARRRRQRGGSTIS